MKNSYILIISAIVLSACGGPKEPALEELIASKDLKQIRLKKTDLDKKIVALKAEIKQLNTAIETLDTVKKMPLITAFKVAETEFKHYLELQGNVKTKQNVLMYPELPGTLQKIYVKEGQYVTKGQLLAKIDDGGLAQQVAQLEATTALAETTFERQKRLWAQKIGSEMQFLQAKTNFTAQKNSLAQLKKQLAKSTLRAPFSGIVDDVIKEEGTVVAPGPGSEVLRLVNLSNMYIEADVPETYITDITVGKNVAITFPVLGKTIATTVRQTGNFINPSNRSFKVEVGVPNTNKAIKPNLTAKLKVNDYTNAKALLVPQNILSENANAEQYVYVLKDIKNNTGVAKQTTVKTGKTQGDIIEILSGITAGDLLINAGARTVKDNQEVKINNL